MIERDSKWIQKNEEAEEEGSPGKEVNDLSDEKIQQTRRQLFPEGVFGVLPCCKCQV